MARVLSEALLIELNREGNNGLGAELGKLCLKANLSITHVARALGVTRMAVHSWLRGGKIRAKNEIVVRAFIKLAREDMDEEILPAKSFKASKAYIEEMIGVEI
jgi:hypothetical protein